MIVNKTPVNKHDILSNIPLSMEVYRVRSGQFTMICEFLEISLTHDPTQPTKKLKNLDSTRPNPWTILIHTFKYLYMARRSVLLSLLERDRGAC